MPGRRNPEGEPTRVERLNAGKSYPRRSRALLNDERTHGVRVLGPVIETAVMMRPRTRDREAVYVSHRTVLVRIDGEGAPRRIEYTRLAEFSYDGGSDGGSSDD